MATYSSFVQAALKVISIEDGTELRRESVGLINVQRETVACICHCRVSICIRIQNTKRFFVQQEAPAMARSVGRAGCVVFPGCQDLRRGEFAPCARSSRVVFPAVGRQRSIPIIPARIRADARKMRGVPRGAEDDLSVGGGMRCAVSRSASGRRTRHDAGALLNKVPGSDRGHHGEADAVPKP